MIVYVDTSVLARAVLPDELGHHEALALLDDDQPALVTGSWTRIELAAALTRAARLGRVEAGPLVEAALGMLGESGRVAVAAAPQDQVEAGAFILVRKYGLRAMDAWHLACAQLILPQLAEPGEERAFATRDIEQAEAARALGFASI